MSHYELAGTQLFQANFCSSFKQFIGIHSTAPKYLVGGRPIHKLSANSDKHPCNSSPTSTTEQAMGQLFNPAPRPLLLKCIAALIKNGIKN